MRPRRAEPAEILAQDARIDRRDDRLHLTRAVILDLDLVEAFVAAPEAEDRKMREIHECGGTCERGRDLYVCVMPRAKS